MLALYVHVYRSGLRVQYLYRHIQRIADLNYWNEKHYLMNLVKILISPVIKVITEH